MYIEPGFYPGAVFSTLEDKEIWGGGRAVGSRGSFVSHAFYLWAARGGGEKSNF